MAVEINADMKNRLRDDGVIKLSGWLDADSLERVESLFSWSMANPGPNSSNLDVVEGSFFSNENTNPAAIPLYHEVLLDLPFDETMLEL